jgi:hypothetical protein
MLTYSHGGKLTINHVGKYTDTKNYTISMFLIAYSQGMKEAFREIKVNFIFNMASVAPVAPVTPVNPVAPVAPVAPVILNPISEITLDTTTIVTSAPVNTTVGDLIAELLMNSSEGSNSTSTSSSSSNSGTALTIDEQENSNSTETSVQNDYSDSEEIDNQM